MRRSTAALRCWTVAGATAPITSTAFDGAVTLFRFLASHNTDRQTPTDAANRACGLKQPVGSSVPGSHACDPRSPTAPPSARAGAAISEEPVGDHEPLVTRKSPGRLYQRRPTSDHDARRERPRMTSRLALRRSRHPARRTKRPGQSRSPRSTEPATPPERTGNVRSSSQWLPVLSVQRSVQRRDARGASASGARLCGIPQVLLACRLFPQLSESPVTKFLFHALPALVRLAKETPGPSLLGAFALVVHVRVRSRAT